MRQAQRWIAVVAVAVLAPAMAGATGEGRDRAHAVVAEGGVFAIALERAGTWFERLTGVLSSVWGATRGTIVPGANEGGDSGASAPTADPEVGG